MHKSRLSQKGFTLAEILIAMPILLLMVGAIAGIYLTFITAWQEDSNQIALQMKASSAIEKMVRGVGGSGGIREAKSGTVTVTGSTMIQYTDINDTVHKYYLDANTKRVYHDDLSDGQSPYMIADNLRAYDVTDDPPSFYVDENNGLITINIGLEGSNRRSDGLKDTNIDYTTQVYLRN